LAKRRLLLKHMALGSVGAAIPMSIFSVWVNARGGSFGMSHERMIVSLALVWILIAAAYTACALRLRPPRRNRE
jgi:hypothetical protein